MHKHLILSAFKKARKERRKIGDNQPSIRKLAKDIAAEIDYNIGERSLRDYYNEARGKVTTNEDINISQIKIVNSLSRYLNHKDYEEFLINYEIEKKKKDDDKPPVVIITNSSEEKSSINENQLINSENFKKNSSNKKNRNFSPLNSNSKRVFIIINTIVLLTVFIFISTNILSKNNERWMIWQEDHYIEIKFDITMYFRDELELYNKSKLDTFKKIKSPSCKTKYFNTKGESITWYWKRGKNDLEVFTSPGVHPINGATLKPMTRYMVREHICEGY